MPFFWCSIGAQCLGLEGPYRPFNTFYTEDLVDQIIASQQGDTALPIDSIKVWHFYIQCASERKAALTINWLIEREMQIAYQPTDSTILLSASLFKQLSKAELLEELWELESFTRYSPQDSLIGFSFQS
ncbi:MAG: hypothetical protein ACFB10_17050 [Salibacteraceae bacterium]